ncbi:MAG TPA: hypothetical protein VGH52_08425 [Gaiellaceae bacterium]|jgi:hypothetical protein
MRFSPRAAAMLALASVSALLLVGSAAASQRHTNHIGKVTDACAAPSDQDIADSDFFWYWPCASFLHVEVNPAGQSLGYVQSTPYAIDCPHACTRPFAAGTSVVLTAYPSNGAAFTGWSGDACAGQGNPCTVTVNGDTQVEADFDGTAIPAATNSPKVTLTIFWGFWSNFGDNADTSVTGFTCFLGSNCSHSYAKGTSLHMVLGDANSCNLAFHVNGSGTFGVTRAAPTWVTDYTVTLNSSTVLEPFIAGSGDPGTCP